MDQLLVELAGRQKAVEVLAVDADVELLCVVVRDRWGAEGGGAGGWMGVEVRYIGIFVQVRNSSELILQKSRNAPFRLLSK